MAKQQGIGYALNIPQEALSKLDLADKKITALADNAEKAEQRIKASFSRMALGIDPFIEKLRMSSEALKNMGVQGGKNPVNAIEDAMKKAKKSSEDFGNSAIRVSNNINTVFSDYIRHLNGASDAARQYKMDMKEMSKYYKQLEKDAAAYAKQAATTPEGALSSAASATSYVARAQAIKNLEAAIKSLNTTDKDYQLNLYKLSEAHKKLTAEQRKVEASYRTTQTLQRSLINTSEQLARKLALVFSVSQIQGYVVKMAQTRGEFELQNKALAAILQNKEKADVLFQQITELAVRSPFQLKELVTYTKQLSAYRIESEKLFDTTKMLADISAGVGVSMDRLILAYGQIRATGYLRGSETRQLTEAGINVLGELADYYSELEGRIVSVNEVMDRQFKRMISFEDVNEIFKRLTSEGGIFFDMQEVQADTVLGMISNLKDSVDIMLNEIGKASEGSLKSAINAVKLLVENYEKVEIVLKAVGAAFAVYIAKAALATIANNMLAKSATEASMRLLAIRKAEGVGVGLFSKVGTSLSAFGSFLKSNPYLIAVAGLTAVVTALAKHNKKVEEARGQYDILTNTLSRSKASLGNIVSSLQKQDDLLRKATRDMSGFTEGTREYEQASSAAAEAERERNVLLGKLQKDFPEVYAQYVAQGESIQDLTEIQSQYNAELSQTLALNYMMKSQEGWFNEGIIKDLSDLASAQKDYNNEFTKIKAIYNETRGGVEVLMSTNERFAKEYGDAVKDVLNSEKDEYQKLLDLRRILFSVPAGNDTLRVEARNIAEASDKAVKEFQKTTNDYAKETREAAKEVDLLIANIMRLSGVDSSEAFKALDDGAKQSAQNWADAFVKSIASMKDKFIQEFVNEKFETTLGFTIDFREPEKKITGLAARINEYIQSNNLAISLVEADEDTKSYFNDLKSKVKDNLTDIEKLNSASERLDETMTNEEKIKSLQQQNAIIEQLLRAFGEWEDKESKTGGSNDALQKLKKQIELIKEVNRQYEELLKNYSAEEAAAKVRESYTNAFAEAGIGDIIGTMQFDVAGAIAALQILMARAGELGRLELERALGQYKANLEVDIRIRNREKLQEEAEQLFDQYDLGQELDKMGLDRNLAEQLFGIEIADIETLKKKLLEMKDQFVGTDGEEAYERYIQKIAQLEQQALEDRLKKYAEYLVKSKDERIRIEEEANREIAEMQAMPQLTDSQKRNIERNIQREKTQQIAELDWEELKGLDLYRQSFEDFERLGTTTLEIILAKLEEFAEKSGQYLDTTSFREMMNNIRNLRDEIESRNPFKSLIEGIKEYKEAQLELNMAQGFVSLAQIEQGSAQMEYQDALIAYDTAPIDEKAEAYERLIQAQARLAAANEMLTTSMQSLTNAENKKNNAMTKASAAAKKIESSYNSMSSAMVDILNLVKDIGEGLGFAFSDEQNAIIDGFIQGFQVMGQVLSVVLSVVIAVTIAGEAMQVALWPLLIIGAALGAIFAIIGAQDAKRQAVIDEEKEKVDDLSRAYDKLRDSFSNAMSFDRLRQTTQETLENLSEQISSYRKMIETEKTRKNADADQIKEWEQEQEDLMEQMKDAREEYIESLGGFGSEENMKSAAEEWASAWYDAFKETGDGLNALYDTFDDFFDDMIKKQLMLKLSEKWLKPLMDEFDKMFSETGLSGEQVSKAELEKLRQLYEFLLQGFNDEALKWMEGLGIEGGTGADNLSELQKGIQGVTEETAQALEALLNSVRFAVYEQLDRIQRLYDAFTSMNAEENPILGELRTQTQLLRSMDTLLSSVVRSGHPKGAAGIKVFLD